MKRLLAVLAAAAMIVGALWYRGVFDSDGTDPETSGRSDAPIRVLCATEAKVACESAFRSRSDVELIGIEDPGTTADGLASAEGDERWDIWIVSEPWPQIAMVRAEISSNAIAVSPSTPLASVTLRVAVATGSPAAACEPGDAGCALTTGRPAGMPPAATTGGAFGAAAIAAHVLGRSDFATNDLDDGTVQQALEGIAQSAAQQREPVARLLAQRGSFDAAVDLGATVPDAQKTRATASDVEPQLVARLVAVAQTNEAPELPAADGFRTALKRSGWSIAGKPPISGLPNPAVVDAVTKLWSNANR